MTELSTDRAWAHKASLLGMSRGGSLTEGAYIFWALRVDMLSRVVLEALYHSGGGRFWVGDDDGIVAGSRLHNHLQSSRECNTSSAHSRSASSVSPSLAALSQGRVMTILFPCGKGDSSGVAREGVGSSGHLGRWVDRGICRGKGVGRRGGSGGARGVGVGSGIGGWIAILLANLHCSLHWVIGAIVHLPLFLR